MPVASVNGLKKAASSAAVQLPPQVLTKIVRVWAIVRSVTISGPAAAAVTVEANPLRNVRRRMVVLLRRLGRHHTPDGAEMSGSKTSRACGRLDGDSAPTSWAESSRALPAAVQQGE